MTAWQRIDGPVAMASRWRRRQVCTLLIDNRPTTVALRDISGSGARVDIAQAPDIGTTVELQHPHAGVISARVSAVVEGGVQLAFDRQESAIAFALGAIAADMSRPA